MLLGAGLAQGVHAESGKPQPRRIHPLLGARLSLSMEPWPVSNCAEFRALNKALLRGADPQHLELLETHTLRTAADRPFARCRNCQTTTHGVHTTSD